MLYLLAAEYRLNRTLYRVTYINDCVGWKRRPYPYLLEELVTTFYDDTIGSKSIVELCQAVTESDKEEKMMTLMIGSLINHVKQNNLFWLVICDQHNAFYARSVVVDQFPFNLIDTLADNRAQNIKVVISASANNEGYPTEMKGWQTHDISSHRFDEDEFKSWCDHYHLETIGKVDPKSEEAVDALFWTGGIPYELDLLWKQPKKGLIEKTLLYREKRVEEIAESHGKFYKKLVDKERDNLAECISRMALSMPPPNLKVGMDRQIFEIVSGEKGDKIIQALNPVARRALLGYHGQGIKSSLELVAELVFDGDYTNDTKGRIIEKYLITMLEISQRFSFKSKRTTKTGLSAVKSIQKMVNIKDIIHFSGNNLPLRSLFNQRLVTLFVPKSSNYPGFDFFIWNPVDEVLMGFQVTIKNPFTSHPKIDEARGNCERWLDFCFDKLNKKPMEVYWIIPGSCVGKPKNFKDRVILLEDLCDDFPLFNKLNL